MGVLKFSRKIPRLKLLVGMDSKVKSLLEKSTENLMHKKVSYV